MERGPWLDSPEQPTWASRRGFLLGGGAYLLSAPLRHVVPEPWDVADNVGNLALSFWLGGQAAVRLEERRWRRDLTPSTRTDSRRRVGAVTLALAGLNVLGETSLGDAITTFLTEATVHDPIDVAFGVVGGWAGAQAAFTREGGGLPWWLHGFSGAVATPSKTPDSWVVDDPHRRQLDPSLPLYNRDLLVSGAEAVLRVRR